LILRAIKLLLAITSLAFVVSACDSLPGRPTQAALPLRPTDVSDFATLYKENCAGCHGVDGKFGAALALNNPVFLAVIDDASMRRVIATGVPGTSMPSFGRSFNGSLTDHQIDLVVDGIRKSWSGSLDAGSGAPPYSSSAAGNPNSGAEVYASNCQLCHGANGSGGSAGSIVDPSYLALVSDQYLRTIVIAGRSDLGHPDWKHTVSGHPLTTQQVSDLVAWISSRRPVPMASN
jgi:cytochrome c oxidase cbb3-type subunit III